MIRAYVRGEGEFMEPAVDAGVANLTRPTRLTSTSRQQRVSECAVVV
jgi:hypothetical protein